MKSSSSRINEQPLFSRIIVQILMVIMSVTILFPIYFMLVNAFKTRGDFLFNKIGLPSVITLQSFIDAFKGKNFMRWFLNSMIITICSCVTTTLIAFYAAFAFAKMKFKGKQFLFNILIPLMSIPPVIIMIPQFKIMAQLKLVNTYLSVIILYIGIMLPLTVYLMRNYFITLPDSLLEAAYVDGASQFAVMTKIVLPLSMSVMFTSLLVNAVWAWNELIIALVFLQKEDLRTLIVGLTIFKSRFSLNVPVIMAGLTIATIPVVAIYVFGQRYLVAGLVAGAVKE